MGGLRTAVVAMGVSFAVLASACGGGDDEPSVADLIDAAEGEGDGLDDEVFGDIGDAAEGDDAGNGLGSIEVVDAPTITADPGLAVVEVDGERLEYPIAGAINVVCEVTPETIQINIQTPEGQSFLLQASTNTGSWGGSLTAAASDSNVQYGSGLFGGVLGIGDDAISYEGPMTKIVDRDIVNAEDVTGTVAVNCASPGGDPSAMVGGESFTFPISGAQSFECEVAVERFEIRVNRLALEGSQLEMQGRLEGDQWVGAVVVYTPDGNLTAPLPADGTGLTVDGTMVTFEGTFTDPDGAESSGSAQATC